MFTNINLVDIFLCNTFAAHLKKLFMIVVPIKEGENIERALKKFKRKFEKTGIVKQLRARQSFKKPSERKRDVVKRAIYIQKLQQEEK